MNITDMICQTSELLTQIKKCQSLYSHCKDKHILYRFIIQEIYRINKVDILLVFLEDDLREDCNIEVLREELLKLYKFQSEVFINHIRKMNKEVVRG